eukprot:9499554-Pyramimonas_sp.AAC.1
MCGSKNVFGPVAAPGYSPGHIPTGPARVTARQSEANETETGPTSSNPTIWTPHRMSCLAGMGPKTRSAI